MWEGALSDWRVGHACPCFMRVLPCVCLTSGVAQEAVCHVGEPEDKATSALGEAAQPLGVCPHRARPGTWRLGYGMGRRWRARRVLIVDEQYIRRRVLRRLGLRRRGHEPRRLCD